MKRTKWIMGLPVGMLFTLIAMVSPSSAEDEKAIEVGRVYYMEGDLFRYVPDGNDWVAMVKDAPFGAEDTLFSGKEGMAEMIVPNGSWIRVGNNTQIQFIALEPDLSEIDVASGIARFYNKGSRTVLKATSPFGYAVADPGTVFDFYVGEDSVEVLALKGHVSFVHTKDGSKYDVAEGSPSILADQDKVALGDGTVDLAWDRWNETRERVWSVKLKSKGRSAEYLPSGLRYEADCLDNYGMWELVPYEGTYCWFWRPTIVDVRWSPFTVGIWTEWCGDQTWIPAEPFGYITHHYGNWVYLRNYWYWAPPVVSVRIGLPHLDLGFFWYPGRVSWIYSTVYVGWVVLAPHEIYYSHHNWGGPHHVVVKKEDATQININIRNYAHSDRPIIVREDKFRGVENYRNVRLTNLHPTIVNKYNAAPIVNNTVIKNYTTNRERYNYTNVVVREKPHNSVINRIRQNETVIRQGRKEDASVLQQEVKNIRDGKVNREAHIEAPKATNYIVPVDDMNRPRSEIKLQQREIKKSRATAPGVRPEVAGAPERRVVAQPERVVVTSPTQAEKTVVQPESVVTTRPTEDEGAVSQPERATPSGTTQEDQTVTRSGRVVITRPIEDEKAVSQPERATPSGTTQEDQTVTRSGRVVITRPTEDDKTVSQPERVAPTRPIQQQPVVQPERTVVPSRPMERSGDSSSRFQRSRSATQAGRSVEKSGQGNAKAGSESSESEVAEETEE